MLIGLFMFLGCLFNIYVFVVLRSGGFEETRGVLVGVVVARGLILFLRVMGLIYVGLVLYK